MKSENLTLSVENEKLRNGLCFDGNSASLQLLEKRLFEKQEELTELHKRKSDHQQLIIDLNVKVTELQKQLDAKTSR